MIVGKDAAVGAPREVVPAAADFSIQEPSLTQLKTMFSEKILVSANRATDERASAAQLLALTDVFHNDDCIPSANAAGTSSAPTAAAEGSKQRWSTARSVR